MKRRKNNNQITILNKKKFIIAILVIIAIIYGIVVAVKLIRNPTSMVIVKNRQNKSRRSFYRLYYKR